METGLPLGEETRMRLLDFVVGETAQLAMVNLRKATFGSDAKTESGVDD
jgi:hypothetical protein